MSNSCLETLLETLSIYVFLPRNCLRIHVWRVKEPSWTALGHGPGSCLLPKSPGLLSRRITELAHSLSALSFPRCKSVFAETENCLNALGYFGPGQLEEKAHDTYFFTSDTCFQEIWIWIVLSYMACAVLYMNWTKGGNHLFSRKLSFFQQHTF